MKSSCCWDSRSYFSLVQTSLLYDVQYSYRPLSAWNSHGQLSMSIADVKILEVGSLRGWGTCRGLKVAKSCSKEGTSYSLNQSLLL